MVAIFCSRLLDGQPLTVFGTGRQTRDYVYVGDVANANLAAATRPLPPTGVLGARAFNIGTGRETSVLELAAQLQRCAGTETPVQLAPARPGEIERSALDIAKAGTVLGWQPTTSLAEGLAATYRHFAVARGRTEKA